MVPLLDLQLGKVRHVDMLIFCKVMELFGVDGESIGIVWRLQKESARIREEGMSQRPSLSTAQIASCLAELLNRHVKV